MWFTRSVNRWVGWFRRFRILVSASVARFIANPIADLLVGVRRAHEQVRSERVPEVGPYELALLGREFNAMAIALETPYRGLERKAGEARERLATVVDATAHLSVIRKAEEERDRFFSLSLDLQGIFGFDGSTRRVNPAFQATLGFTSEEVLARPFLDFIHPDDREAARADLVQLAAGRTRHDVDLRCLCKDGSYRRIAWTSVAVVEDGLFYSVGRDITERRRVEQALEERARLAELGAEVGVVLTRDLPLREMLQRSADNLVRYVDAAFARVWTLSPGGEVLELQASSGMYTHLDGPHGRVPFGRFKIGMIAQRLPHLTNSVIGDPLISEQEWAAREGMISFAGYPLLVDDRLVGVMAVFARHPLSDHALQAMSSVSCKLALAIERRWAEQALREGEERFRLLSACSPVGIFTTDVQGRCTYINPRLLAILGYMPEDFAGDGWQRFIHPEDRDLVLERWSAAKRETMTSM